MLPHQDEGGKLILHAHIMVGSMKSNDVGNGKWKMNIHLEILKTHVKLACGDVDFGVLMGQL